MSLAAPDHWVAEVELDGNPIDFNYFFVVKAPGKAWRFEWGQPHRYISGGDKISHVKIFDAWKDMPADKPYYSSAFVNGMLLRRFKDQPLASLPRTLQFRIEAPLVEPDEVLCNFRRR